MFEWTKDVIRFRMDAAEYNHFDSLLAQELMPYLPHGAHICDAGCGLGYLSIALAQSGYRVTAVDTDESALQVLRENSRRLELSHLRVVQDDLFSMQPSEPFDSMIFCFFGKTVESLRAVKRQCRGKAFLIKKAWPSHRFTTEEKPLRRFTFQQTCQELDELGIGYEAKTVIMDTGQPFRSFPDVMRFFQLYGKGAEYTQQAVRQRLCLTDSAEFPLYLPSVGEVGIIMVHCEQIPEFIDT